MTTDPVQEARDAVIATAHDGHKTAQLIAALDDYAAAIRREEAARVLPVLRHAHYRAHQHAPQACSGCAAVEALVGDDS